MKGFIMLEELHNQYFAMFASDPSVRIAAKTFCDIERAALNQCIRSGVTWDEVKFFNCHKKEMARYQYIAKDKKHAQVWKEVY